MIADAQIGDVVWAIDTCPEIWAYYPRLPTRLTVKEVIRGSPAAPPVYYAESPRIVEAVDATDVYPDEAAALAALIAEAAEQAARLRTAVARIEGVRATAAGRLAELGKGAN